MTTATLEQAIKREQKPPRRRAEPRPIERGAQSDRFAIANREWYPGLRAYYAERASVRPAINSEESGAVGTEKAPPASNHPQFTDRFAMANREWFPALCMTGTERKSCTSHKPDSEVSNCSELG